MPFGIRRRKSDYKVAYITLVSLIHLDVSTTGDT